MRQLVLIFMGLLSVFFLSWGYKASTPVNRPSNYVEELETPWYESSYTAPAAMKEWILDANIPSDHIPVPGEDNLYMVIDDAGNILYYHKRIQTAEGQWRWEKVDLSEPAGFTPVEGMEDIYQYINDEGEPSYIQYVRNDDGSYAYVPTDEKGNPLDLMNDANEIGKNYIHDSGNTYRLYNDAGVFTGYRNRIADGNGGYKWTIGSPPQLSDSGFGTLKEEKEKAAEEAKQLEENANANVSVPDTPTVDQTADNTGVKTERQPDRYEFETVNPEWVETTTETNTVTENGQRVTYERTTTNVYSTETGELIRTEVSDWVPAGSVDLGVSDTPDPGNVMNSLSGEYARVSESVSYNTSKASEIIASINSDRVAQGLSELHPDMSGEAYMLAAIRAADMALYDHASPTSPTYGSLQDMISKWGVSTQIQGENIIKLSDASGSDIHLRLFSEEDSRSRILNSGASGVAVAVVERNGMVYVSEVFY